MRRFVLIVSQTARAASTLEVSGRTVERQDRVDAVVLEQDRKGVGVAAPRASPTGRRDCPGSRPAAAPRIEAGQRLRRQLGEAAFVDDGVGREDAEPAAVGHDRKAVAGHRRAPRISTASNSSCSVRTRHAGAPEGRLVDGVGAGERPGVGGGRTGALLVAPGLEDDHRLERAAARAADMNLRAWVTASTYRRMAEVAGSRAR